MSIIKQRREAIDSALRSIREIKPREDLSHLAAVRDVLSGLAAKRELFPSAHFPVKPGTPGGLYRLSEDKDHRFALYASVGVEGRKQTPHRHPVWAIILGVKGVEQNVVFERIDDGSVPGEGDLRKRFAVGVGPGDSLILTPPDFHTIHVNGNDPSLHLHFYDLAVDRWVGEFPIFRSPESREYDISKRTREVRPRLVSVPELRQAEIGGIVSEGMPMTAIAVGAVDAALKSAFPDVLAIDNPNAIASASFKDRSLIVLMGDEHAVEDTAANLVAHGQCDVVRFVN